MRRLFWMGVGAVAGSSGTLWAERKVRNRLETLQPDHLVVAAGNRAKTVGRSMGRSVADAVAEGRGAMKEKESQLRGRYTPSGDLQSGDEPGGSTQGSGRPARHATRPRSADWPASRSSPQRHR